MFYIFMIAVLNLGLGFAVACYLGRRCRGRHSLGELPLVDEESKPGND